MLLELLSRMSKKNVVFAHRLDRVHQHLHTSYGGAPPGR